MVALVPWLRAIWRSSLADVFFVTSLQREPCCNKKLVVTAHGVSSSDLQRERWDQLKERHSQKNRLLSVADS